MITLYTDGACKNTTSRQIDGSTQQGSIGMGGWAWWVHDHLWDSGAIDATTNNRMEMLAVIQGLVTIQSHLDPEPLLIVSDSSYVVNCFADQWYVNWRRNGWRNSNRAPVVNQDLWERMLALYEAHPAPITFRHCRGHGKGGIGDAPHVHGNDQADKLAVAARLTLEYQH